MERSEYKIVRTQSAGVFFGKVKELDLHNKSALIENARRIWFWKGAASLSELAVRGVKYPEACKFPTPVPYILVMDVVEILDVTPQAKESIDGVPEWKA